MPLNMPLSKSVNLNLNFQPICTLLKLVSHLTLNSPS